MRFKEWLMQEGMTNFPEPIRKLTFEEARELLLRIEQKGKHGEHGDIENVYPWLVDKNDLPGERWYKDNYYLINAPIDYIDHEYYDPFQANKYIGPSKGQEERIQKYMKMEGEIPPILLNYGKYSFKRGWPLANATNGNHRLEVAKRRGSTHIQALIPVKDYERWKAFHTSGREYWDQDRDKEMFLNHPLKVGQNKK